MKYRKLAWLFILLAGYAYADEMTERLQASNDSLMRFIQADEQTEQLRRIADTTNPRMVWPVSQRAEVDPCYFSMWVDDARQPHMIITQDGKAHKAFMRICPWDK
jgi:hypothetical protein